MEKNVLQDKEIKQALKRDVVYLSLDVERNKEIVGTYGVRAYPTTLLIEKTGKRITQIPGYLEKSDFKTLLSYAKTKAYKKMGLVDYLRYSNRK